MEQQPLRGTDVRDRNQKLILRLMFQEGLLSQSMIVQRTGLKAPTVFRIFTKLEEERFIQPCSPAEVEHIYASGERKGRRPAYYRVNPRAAFAVGVDFSTAGASVVVVNFVNEVIHHQSVEFSPGINSNEVLDRIGVLIGSAIDTSGISPRNIVGIGIGAPGSVDTETGMVVDYERIVGLAGFPLKEHFTNRFGVPVFVHNNASVITASEYHYESAQEYKSALAVLVRGGVGAAFMDHGKIFLNGSTTALELGRTSVGVVEARNVSSDPRTLESVVSEQPLLELLGRSSGVDSWAEAEEQLDEKTLAISLAGPASALATAVRNLYHILQPEAVLVISRYGKLATVLSNAVASAVPEVTAIPVTYDPVKACYGATDMVFQAFFAG